MNINNIALVRATNVIPFEGEVRPVSEVPYLQKEKGREFYFAMSDLLRRKGMLKEIDWTKPEEEMLKIEKYNEKIIEEYLPYSSSYNSMVLWSLNGIVPDDINNTFSNKDCAIIDGLEEQIEQSEIVSLVPTDTAIKGNVKLSNKANILISKERYKTLSQEEKQKLSELDLTVSVFEGEISEAVKQNLKESGRYTPETLSLTRKDKGYLKSETSDDLIKTIDNIAKEKDIAQVLFYNVFTSDYSKEDAKKLKSVKDEYKNTWEVMNFYKHSFHNYLFSGMDIDKRVKANVDSYAESPVYMEDLCNEIERLGIDEYKKTLDKYNGALEKLREKGILYTPQQIVDFIKERKEIDLVSLIKEEIKQEENVNKTVLRSGIEATEETTKLTEMDKQLKNIEEINKEKTVDKFLEGETLDK